MVQAPLQSGLATKTSSQPAEEKEEKKQKREEKEKKRKEKIDPLGAWGSLVVCTSTLLWYVTG